jgi:hypothetical protein
MNVVKVSLVGKSFVRTIVKSDLTPNQARAMVSTLNDKRDTGSDDTESDELSMVSYVTEK